MDRTRLGIGLGHEMDVGMGLWPPASGPLPAATSILSEPPLMGAPIELSLRDLPPLEEPTTHEYGHSLPRVAPAETQKLRLGLRIDPADFLPKTPPSPPQWCPFGLSGRPPVAAKILPEPPPPPPKGRMGMGDGADLGVGLGCRESGRTDLGVGLGGESDRADLGI